MQFEPSTAVYDACRIIRERVPEAQTGQGENDFKNNNNFTGSTIDVVQRLKETGMQAE